MASSFWKGVVGVGLFALAHAAFSAAQREYEMRREERTYFRIRLAVKHQIHADIDKTGKLRPVIVSEIANLPARGSLLASLFHSICTIQKSLAELQELVGFSFNELHNCLSTLANGLLYNPDINIT